MPFDNPITLSWESFQFYKISSKWNYFLFSSRISYPTHRHKSVCLYAPGTHRALTSASLGSTTMICFYSWNASDTIYVGCFHTNNHFSNSLNTNWVSNGSVHLKHYLPPELVYQTPQVKEIHPRGLSLSTPPHPPPPSDTFHKSVPSVLLTDQL